MNSLNIKYGCLILLGFYSDKRGRVVDKLRLMQAKPLSRL